MYTIPFQTIDWTNIEAVEYKGETGSAFWKTFMADGLRIRQVTYSAGYKANHWCTKGHIVHCMEGTFYNELQSGEITIMKKGMTYIVSDDMSIHRSSTDKEAMLLIIDGDFLKRLNKDLQD
jgi:hypothetical protein